MKWNMIAMVALFALSAAPLQALTCPGQCDWPVDPGGNPRCNQYYVLIVGCFGWGDQCEVFTCHWTASVDENNEEGVVLADLDSEAIELNQDRDLCRGFTEVDGPENEKVEASENDEGLDVEVLKTVRIPART